MAGPAGRRAATQILILEGLGAQVQRCLNAPVIGLVGALAAAGLTAWLFRRRVKQRADSAAQGKVIKVPCLLRHPSLEGRWLRGRLLTGPAVRGWEPRTKAGATVSLPDDVRAVSVRSPSWREALRINGRSRIVECASAEGTLLVVVMPNELDHVLTALSGRAE
ncbi:MULTISPECIES: hypothetical protein [unclassified Streptomyces]|uniref:hypothetical protein n=1 Tax=unclassified Streptomyces TaxID=2593676 RepID=UPI0020CA82E6|nr:MULTISPECIES: hypothetical protein [unclassified Streptomyces]